MNDLCLQPGDTIGLASPSHLATPEGYAPLTAAIEALGYRVRLAPHLYDASWGYAAADDLRAEDLNTLIRDETVRMIFFSGGEGADDVLPLLDYEAAAAHPKLWLSYSDGTSILNSVWAATGTAMCLYGQSPAMLPGMNEYSARQFDRFVRAGGVKTHEKSGPWRTLCPGTARGILTGGYLDNFLFLVGSGRVKARAGEKYVLFLEDHEQFFGIEHESELLSRLEQMPLLRQTTGLLFGHYSSPVNERLLERLTRLGNRNGIPVCYCDDFGHGEGAHGILPIGARATLDATAQTLAYE